MKPSGSQWQVIIAGSGGQGLGAAGLILAEAALLSGRNAVHNQSYGAQARGGLSQSSVIISSEEIVFPFVQRPNLILALNLQGYCLWRPRLVAGGVAVIDRKALDGSPFHQPSRAGCSAQFPPGNNTGTITRPGNPSPGGGMTGPSPETSKTAALEESVVPLSSLDYSYGCEYVLCLSEAAREVCHPLGVTIAALGAASCLTGIVDLAILDRTLEARFSGHSLEANRRALAAGCRLVSTQTWSTAQV